MRRNSELHRSIYFYLVVLLAASLPLSIYASSFLQFVLGFNWLLEGDFRKKWQRLRQEKAFWIYGSFYALHIIGMLWSSDLAYGLQDLKIKLPMIIIPFIVVTSGHFSKSELRAILTVFIAACIAGSFVSVLAITGLLPVEINDFRDASIFIGHIRFALMIVLSILFSVYFLFSKTEEENRHMRLFYLFAIVWLPVFLILLRSLSGIVIIVIVTLFLSLNFVGNIPDRTGRFMVSVVILFIPLFAIIYVGNSINRFYNFEELNPEEIDSYTVNGNPYVNHLDNRETENGHYVWIHVCPEELEKEWNKLSDIDYMGKAENGDILRFTLIRYLTSRGLRKDSAGIQQLDSTDIAAIEKGIANHIFLRKFALYPRIYEVIWEFDRFKLGYSANDKSLVQRYFYLKAGAHIALENMLIGVGTGDVRKSFEKYYDEVDSQLRLERRRRAHNQYLSLAIALGIPGFVLCMLSLVLPVFVKKRWRSYMLLVFILTMGLSMLDEDTLENTPGVVIFGLFYALFVFGPDWKWKTRASGSAVDENNSNEEEDVQ